MIEPYNGLLNIFDSVKSIKKTKKYKKSYLFYTNSSGERFWIKYLAYYAVKTYELVESIDYMWSDSPLRPLHSTKKNKMKAFYKWSSRYQKKSNTNGFYIMTDDSVKSKINISKLSDNDIKKISKMDYCYLMKIEMPQNGYENTEIFMYRNKINRKFSIKFEKVLMEKTYDLIVVMNGALFENAVALKLANIYGIKCITIEIGEKTDKILMAENKEAWCFDSKKYFDIYKEYYSKKEQMLKTVKILEDRKHPKLGINNASQFQKAELVTPDQITNVLNIPLGNKIALACTNVAWDSAVLGKGRAFHSQREWILFLLEYFRNKPNWFLVVRIHPHEKEVGTNAPVSKIINEYINNNPMTNMAVVGDEIEINTYSIAQIANIGLVYSSSVGMEMAMDGLPVITAANVHYSNLGFTFDPTTPHDFEKCLDEAEELGKNLKPNFSKNAVAYYGIYHNEIFKKAPWNWADYEKNGFVGSFMETVNNESKIFDILSSGDIYA